MPSICSAVGSFPLPNAAVRLIPNVSHLAFAAYQQLNSHAAKETESSDKQTEVAGVASDAAVENVQVSSVSEEPVVEIVSVPTEFKSALNSAKSYSDMMYMSKMGLYGQLTSEYGEQFSPEAAQYAIDNVNADWNTNALKTAENYAETMYMSKAGIYDQLVSENGEQFTAEEAQYAIDNIRSRLECERAENSTELPRIDEYVPEAARDQLTPDYGEKVYARRS